MKVMQVHSDGLSFSQALQNIKSPSQQSLVSSRSVKENTLSRYKSQSRIASFRSPKAKLISRTNTTLRNILEEFKHLPNNQYVLCLGFNYMKSSGSLNFDEWICSVNSKEKYNRLSNEYYPQQQRKKAIIRQQIQLQADNIRLKTEPQNSQRLNPKPYLDNKKDREQASEPPKKHKFSFSGFFQQTESTMSWDRSKGEVVTKISIMNQSYLEDEVIQEQAAREIQKEQQSQPLLKGTKDKENENPNCITEIKGLQFSKNRRYKTTKKKRKNKE